MHSSSPAQELGAGANHGRARGDVTRNTAPELSSSTPSRTQADARTDPEALLAQILNMPKVSGAAIGIAMGNHFECTQSSGESAPATGSRCYPGLGLTGMCISSGRLQLCNDVESDARIDREACVQLAVRSVLVLPIKHESAVTAVIEVLSSQPNAFGWREIRHIKRISSKTAGLLRPAFRPQPPNRLHAQSEGAFIPKLPNQFELQEVLHAIWLVQQNGELPRESRSPIRDNQAVSAQAYASKPVEVSNLERPHQPEAAAPILAIADKPTNHNEHVTTVISVLTAVALLFSFLFLFRGHVASRGSALPGFTQQTSSASISSSSVFAQDSKHSNKAESQSGFTNGAPLLNSAERHGKKPVPQSYAEVMTRFAEAAKNGNADASWNLGMGYLRGIGVPKDERTAAEWLKKAANLGDTRAQNTLSDLYLNGVGVPRDYVKAYTWGSIAAGQLGGGEDRLPVLRKRMTSAQLQAANHRITAFFAQKTNKH